VIHLCAGITNDPGLGRDMAMEEESKEGWEGLLLGQITRGAEDYRMDRSRQGRARHEKVREETVSHHSISCTAQRSAEKCSWLWQAKSSTSGICIFW